VDESVLVHIVQPRKLGEVRVRRARSVLKGLAPLDECPIVRAYAAKHPYAGLIPLPSFIDGELRITSGAASPEEHELPNEVVKRGPQVVAELADDDADPGVGRIAVDPKDIFARVALELTNDSAVFLVKPREESEPFLIERGQVLVRSFQSPIDGF
jgi:hypothetical protein